MKTLAPIHPLKTLRLLLMLAGLLSLWVYRAPLWNLVSIIGDPQAIVAYLRGHGTLGPAILFLLMLVQVFIAFIPGHALVAASGYTYGAPLTIAIVSLSAILGSQVAFAVTRRAGRPIIDRLASPEQVERWDRLAGNRGPLFYFFMFVLPFIPSDLMCYVAGMGKISPKGFFAANCAGRISCTTGVALIGVYGWRSTWFWLWFAVYFAVLYLAWGVYNKSFRIFASRSELAYACGLGLMKAYRFAFGLEAEVRGLTDLPPGPKILAANHPNASDIFLIPLHLTDRITLVAQGNFFRMPIIGWILTHSGHIPVHPEDRHTAFEQACQALLEGKTILIFPEGRLNPDNREFKVGSGAVRMSLATGAPIIPIGISVAARDTVSLGYGRQDRTHAGRWQFRGRFTATMGPAWIPSGEAVGGAEPLRARELTRRLMLQISDLAQQAERER